jgi:DNA-binding NtrC family response regulator
MARIVIVAGTDAGQDVAAALSAAGHEVIRTESLPADAHGGDAVFIEPWLFAAGTTPADVPVVLLTSHEAVAAAVDAVKAGAYDLVRVPCSRDEILLVAERAIRHHHLVQENEQLREEVRNQVGGEATVASSDEQVASIANTSGDDEVAAVAKTLAGKPLADIEKQVILRTLEQFKGHRLRTAAALGIGVRTLGMKIKRWREEGEPIAGRNHGQQQQRSAVHVDVS